MEYLLIEDINHTGIAGLIDTQGNIVQFFPDAEIGRAVYEGIQTEKPAIERQAFPCLENEKTNSP